MPITAADYPKYVAEFIGTYILVLTVGCNVLSGAGTFAVISIASALMVMVYALGSVSGAHFNPAVTFSVLLAQKMKGGWQQALLFMVSQVGCLEAGR